MASPEEARLDPIWKTGEVLGTDPDCSPTKVCRNARDFTFDGIAEDGEDLATAWKRVLVAEGKASPDGTGIRDLFSAGKSEADCDRSEDA
ncbi:MAG: hypothetical protein OXN44_07575 [Acidimicrobiaceae bacterium]|nr:hypothetical protein [Acidimicrobiaceae bacterium]MDE0605751.1 hypothetical protein [Acidimicrobiaceae bacterium]